MSICGELSAHLWMVGVWTSQGSAVKERFSSGFEQAEMLRIVNPFRYCLAICVNAPHPIGQLLDGSPVRTFWPAIRARGARGVYSILDHTLPETPSPKCGHLL